MLGSLTFQICLLLLFILQQLVPNLSSSEDTNLLSKNITALPNSGTYQVDPEDGKTSFKVTLLIFIAVQGVITLAVSFASFQVYKWCANDYYKRTGKLNDLVVAHYETKYGPLMDDWVILQLGLFCLLCLSNTMWIEKLKDTSLSKNTHSFSLSLSFRRHRETQSPLGSCLNYAKCTTPSPLLPILLWC